MGKHIPQEHPKQRPDLFNTYVENIASYIHQLHPECSQTRIVKWAQNVVESQYEILNKRYREALANGEDLQKPRKKEEQLLPTLNLIRYADENDKQQRHSYGNITYDPHADLLGTINRYRGKVISPFGSYYETADVMPSFLKDMIDGLGKKRKQAKKVMLKCKKENDRTAETYWNNIQATIKINMNSIIGGMGCNGNFLSSVSNFNSVTSISRFFVMNAYAHAERFLESNFYFRTEDQVITHLVVCHRNGPSKEAIRCIIDTFDLHIPSAEEVSNFLLTALKRYTIDPITDQIPRYVATLDEEMRTFIFYMSNLYQLITKNETFWKPWMQKFFSPETSINPADCNAEDLGTLDGDLVVVLSTVYHSIVPTNKSGNTISPYDCIKEAPEVAKQLYAHGKHMQLCLDEIQSMFDLFMDHKVGVGFVPEHKNMYRDTVVTSDTDSIIFTTKTWVKWFNGDLKVIPESFNINSLIVYWVSKSTANMLFHLSEAFNGVGAGCFSMNMKNEFMMPIEILTSLKKHYASILKIQEGVFYSTPRLDIKGVNLRGSNFSKQTLNFVTWFIQSIIDDIYNHGHICAKKYIVYTLMFEAYVRQDLLDGNTQFLTVDPVKNKEEYAEADRSIYFNYLFWEEVFAKKYGAIAIPTKCYILPLKNIKHPSYLYFLEEKSPKMVRSLESFIKKYPTKDITRIPINPLTSKIPEELIVVADIENVVYSNAKPLHLMLKSFGINTGASKKQTTLFSDLYGWIQTEPNQKQSIIHILDDGSCSQEEQNILYTETVS